jgi:hypothetical protein
MVSAFVLTGCFPTHESWPNAPVSSTAAFRDATTGEAIGKVLVLPCYHSENGVFDMVEGRGPKMQQEWMADPIICEDGKGMVLKKSSLTGVQVTFFIFGTMKDVRRVFIMAPGYHGRWLDVYSLSEVKCDLQPMGAKDALDELGNLRIALVDAKRLDGIPVRLKAHDEKVIAAWFTTSNSLIRSAAPASSSSAGTESPNQAPEATPGQRAATVPTPRSGEP